MTKKNKPLRSLIYGRYDSEADFAKALGWPRQRLNKITNGTKTPNIEEVYAISKGLERPIGEIARFFLPS